MSWSVRSPRAYGAVRLRGDQWRTGHRLDTAGDEEVAITRNDRLAGTDNGREPRGAQPVDRHAGDRLGQPREQRGEAGNVAVVLTGLIRASEPHVLDLARGNAGPLDCGGDRDRGEVVGANLGEGTPVPADGRPDCRQDDCLGHVAEAFLASGISSRKRSINSGIVLAERPVSCSKSSLTTSASPTTTLS